MIIENQEEAVPCLIEAVEKALQEKQDLDEEYQLHFYAMFLLGQFQYEEAFPVLLDLASLDQDTLDYLIGDTVTSGLNDVLYLTFDGDFANLETHILNHPGDEYARAAMLDVEAQLYLDGRVERKHFEEFLRRIIENGLEQDYFSTVIAQTICDLHFWGMRSELWQLFELGYVELGVAGSYDSYIDDMFSYERKEEFCRKSIDVMSLKSWALFADENDDSEDKSERMDELYRAIMREEQKSRQAVKAVKIGRNDPCPCGSGRKYKQCCMRREQEMLRAGMETVEEQKKWLKDYPQTGTIRQEGQIYLEDYFDTESIEIDRSVYLALKHRAVPVWAREDEKTVQKRKMAYLCAAFEKLKDKAEKENIATGREYDEKYMIHYSCLYWLWSLMNLLNKSGDTVRGGEVSDFCRIFCREILG